MAWLGLIPVVLYFWIMLVGGEPLRTWLNTRKEGRRK